MMHHLCCDIEYFVHSVGLLVEYFVAILLVCQHCGKRKKTINLWVPLFFLSWLDLKIKGGKDSLFMSWD